MSDRAATVVVVVSVVSSYWKYDGEEKLVHFIAGRSETTSSNFLEVQRSSNTGRTEAATEAQQL